MTSNGWTLLSSGATQYGKYPATVNTESSTIYPGMHFGSCLYVDSADNFVYLFGGYFSLPSGLNSMFLS